MSGRRWTEMYQLPLVTQAFLERNPAFYAGMLYALGRETTEILEAGGNGVFLRETISSTYMLAADTPEIGMQWLQKHEQQGYRQMVLADQRLANFAQARYGFTERLVCYRAAYLREKPPVFSGMLQMRRATATDFSLIAAHYDMLSEGELREVIRRGQLWIGYCGDEPVGFIGQHLEGSMGLLEIFPEYRQKGYATELEGFMIGQLLAQGELPYCEVETDNQKSLGLQKKLGMTLTEEKIYWLY